MTSFTLQIVTVREPLFEGEAISLHCTGIEGQMTILAKHEPLITKLVAGTLTIQTPDNEKQTLDINEGGVLEVAHNKVVVLCSKHEL